MSLQGPGRQPNNASSMSVSHLSYPGPPNIRGMQPMAAYPPTGAMPPAQPAFQPNSGQYMAESMMRPAQAVGGYGGGGPQFTSHMQRPLRPMLIRPAPPQMAHQQEYLQQRGVPDQAVYNAVRMPRPHPPSQPAPAMPLASQHAATAWAVQHRAMPPPPQTVITIQRQTVAPNVTVEYPATAVMQPAGSDLEERPVEVMPQPSYLGHYGRYPQPPPQTAIQRQSDSSDLPDGYQHWPGQTHTGPYFSDSGWQGQSSGVPWPGRPESLYQAARPEPPPAAARPFMYAPRDMSARHQSPVVQQYPPRLTSPTVEPMQNYVICAGRSQVPTAYGQGQPPYAHGYVQDRSYAQYGQNVTEMGDQSVETEEDRYSQNQTQNFVTNQPPTLSGTQLQYAGHTGGTRYEVGFAPPAHATQFAYENNTVPSQNTLPPHTSLHNTVQETVQASRPKRPRNALKIINPNTGEDVMAGPTSTTKQPMTEVVMRSERRSPAQLLPDVSVSSRERAATEMTRSVNTVSHLTGTVEVNKEQPSTEQRDLHIASDSNVDLRLNTDSPSAVDMATSDSQSVSFPSAADEILVRGGIEAMVDMAASQWEAENQPSAVSDTDSGCIRDNDETGSQEANESSPVDSRLRRLSSDTLTTAVGISDEDALHDGQKLLTTDEMEGDVQVVGNEVFDHEELQGPQSALVTGQGIDSEELSEEKEEGAELMSEQDIVERTEVVEEPRVSLELGEMFLQSAVDETSVSEKLEELADADSSELEDLNVKESDDKQEEVFSTTESTQTVALYVDESLPDGEYVEEIPAGSQHLDDVESAESTTPVHVEDFQSVKSRSVEDVEVKKEKSTDCDSALIPLLCVHG